MPADRPPETSRRTATLLTALSFFGPFLLYLRTAARTAQGGDTTEFATIGWLGGVAHPPGYPLYTLLVRLAAHLPLGSPFFRISLVSVVCGAAAVAVLQRMLWRLTGHAVAATFSALAFGVVRQQWRMAGVPEVFSLHVLLVALVLLCSLRLAEAAPTEQRKQAGVLGLVCGLGLSNHLTIIFCAPIVLWAFLTACRARGSWLALILFAGGILVGLLPYAELVWAARTAPPEALVWGETSTWRGLLMHLLRREYGTFSLGTGGQSGPLQHELNYARSIPVDLGYVWIIPALGGLVVAWRRQPGWTLATLCSLLLAGPVFISRFNLPLNATGMETEARFYLLPHLLLFTFVAFGVAWLLQRSRLAAAIVVAAVLLLAGFNFFAADWSRDSAVESMLTAIVDSMQPEGVLVGRGDVLLSGMTWTSHVLKRRPDVHYVDANLLATPWYVERLRRTCPACALSFEPRAFTPVEVAAQLVPRAPSYITHSVGPPPAGVGIQLQPNGFLDRAVPANAAPVPLEETLKQLERATETFGDQPAPVDAWSGSMHVASAQAWLSLAERMRAAGRVAEAEQCFAEAAKLLPPEESR